MNFGMLGFPPGNVDARDAVFAYTSPGDYIFVVPDDVFEIQVWLFGAGGGGGGGNTGIGNTTGGTGGHGAALLGWKMRVYPGQAIPVTVPSGGTGGAYNNSVPGQGITGATGGSAKFGYLVATGGIGGTGASNDASTAINGSTGAVGSVSTEAWQEYPAIAIPNQPAVVGGSYGNGGAGGFAANNGSTGENGAVFISI